MKLLVTGGRGFIGRYVAQRALARGHEVRVLGRPRRSSEGSAPAGVETVEHDLTGRTGLTEAVAGVDAVVHCAAAMGGAAELQEAVTVEGTTNLLSAMGDAGVRNIVCLSTFAVYDFDALPRDSLLDEDSALEEDFDARSPYVRVKRKQEELVRAVAGGRGWRWTVLRPGVVFGPGRTWFYHLGVRVSDNRWISYAGGGLFPVTYVENCADAVVAALDATAASGATLNVVDDGLPTRRLYLEELARATAQTPTITDVPWEVLDPASRAATWINRRIMLGGGPLPDLLRSKRLSARCKPLAYSNRRAKEALGWRPRVAFEDAMRRSVAVGDQAEG